MNIENIKTPVVIASAVITVSIVISYYHLKDIFKPKSK